MSGALQPFYAVCPGLSRGLSDNSSAAGGIVRRTEVIDLPEESILRVLSRRSGQDERMTFNWKTPPWQRNEDATHMAVMIADAGGGQVSLVAEGVRGDDATEALADLLMGPGSGAVVVPQSGLIGVVVRRGIDVMWMAQPPIQVARGEAEGEWNIAVDAAGVEVTAFSAADTRGLYTRLQAEYGAK